jgi:glycosyltransferase involved in cell wall biosynthesis
MPLITKSVTLDNLPPPPVGKTGWPWTEGSQPLLEQIPDGSEFPRITIVTPSYNQGQFIEETIRSVLLQGYPNLEYIIIDGGSTDNSVEVIKQYAPWLSYWVSEPDQGQADALNKGFVLSTGKICAYLNSDDVLMLDTLHKVATIFKQLNCYWLASRVLVGDLPEKATIWEPGIPGFPGFVVQQSFAQQGVFWKSDVVPKPYFDPKHRYIMDHSFFVKIYKLYASPYILNQVTAFFRIHNNSKTSTLGSVLEKELEELREEIREQSSNLIAKQIHLEQKRKVYKQEALCLLTTKYKSLYKRLSLVLRAIQLVISDPYPFRDRIFISVVVKLVIRVFISNFQMQNQQL